MDADLNDYVPVPSTSGKKKKKKKKASSSSSSNISNVEPSGDECHDLTRQETEEKFARALSGIKADDIATMFVLLPRCHITDKRLKKLVDAMKKNETVTVLDLSGNQITDTGAKSFAEALAGGVGKGLIDLNLRDNQLSEEGIREFEQLTAKRKTMKIRFKSAQPANAAKTNVCEDLQWPENLLPGQKAAHGISAIVDPPEQSPFRWKQQASAALLSLLRDETESSVDRVQDAIFKQMNSIASALRFHHPPPAYTKAAIAVRGKPTTARRNAEARGESATVVLDVPTLDSLSLNPSDTDAEVKDEEAGAGGSPGSNTQAQSTQSTGTDADDATASPASSSASRKKKRSKKKGARKGSTAAVETSNPSTAPPAPKPTSSSPLPPGSVQMHNNSTCGIMGTWRLNLVETINELCSKHGSSQMFHRLARTPVLKAVVSLLPEFPNASLLQLPIRNIVKVILDRSPRESKKALLMAFTTTTPLDETSGERESVLCFLIDQCTAAVNEKPASRSPSVGHAFSCCQILLNSSRNDPFVKSSLERDCAQWTPFVETVVPVYEKEQEGKLLDDPELRRQQIAKSLKDAVVD
eukprot:Rmarinus@m.8288